MTYMCLLVKGTPLGMTYFTEDYAQRNLKEGLEAVVFIFHIKKK